MNTTLLAPANPSVVTTPRSPRPAAPFSSARLVGIGGSGMKSLAELLGDLGCHVSGSDARRHTPALRDLRRRGLCVECGHGADFAPDEFDALVYSPAIRPDNPERQRASALGVPQFSLPQVLGWLMENRIGVSVAGTHGKSTTTAMIAWILRFAYESPTAFIGAEMRRLQRGGWAGRGDYFVVESCEYQRNFLHLQPRHAVITGVEPDHFETYPDRASLVNAFARFSRKLGPEGVLIVPGDCPWSLEAARLAESRFETFGDTSESNWWFDEVRQCMDGTRFRIFCNADFVTEVTLPLYGRHNVMNALAASAMCANLGVPAAMIRDALNEFPGVSRRFEPVGVWRGVTVVDDYAHHPTAVRSTLQTARDLYRDRRLWCVFQPHQTQRVERLMDEFAGALSPADRVLVTPAYSARETEGPAKSPGGLSEKCSRELVLKLTQAGVDGRFCPSLDRILPSLEDEARPGDVVVLMGAGDIERIRHELARRISRHHSNG